MACPDDNTLAELAQGCLPAAAMAEVELHVDACEACRRLLSALAKLSLDNTVRRDAPGGSGATLDFQPGEVIDGKYRIERSIGAGGMGLVYAATHVALRQRVALKFMRPSALGNAEASARFLREARLVARIKSEHVGRVIDLGMRDDGTPFIVMEYLEGEDLDRLLVRKGPLSVPEAAVYFLQALEAVAEAHRAGVVHRDLKPANLFLTTVAGGKPCIKVLDFGVSKWSEPRDTAPLRHTDVRTVMGSPLYMAPEQLLSSANVDARADIWSLGCSLYQLVSGHLPFDGANLAELSAKVLQATPLPVRNWRPELPATFDAVVSRCLAKKPQERFRNVAELANALAPFAPPEAQSLAREVAVVLGVSVPGRRRAAAKRWVPAVGAGASLCLLAALVVVLFSARGRQASAMPGPAVRVDAALMEAPPAGQAVAEAEGLIAPLSPPPASAKPTKKVALAPARAKARASAKARPQDRDGDVFETRQ